MVIKGKVLVKGVEVDVVLVKFSKKMLFIIVGVVLVLVIGGVVVFFMMGGKGKKGDDYVEEKVEVKVLIFVVIEFFVVNL